MNRAWTVEGLAALYALSVAGSDLRQMADALGRFSSDCDRALWVLFGRTPEQALDVLNGGRAPDLVEVAPEPPPRRGSPVGRFLREMFS